jgi:hypothetical protein
MRIIRGGYRNTVGGWLYIESAAFVGGLKRLVLNTVGTSHALAQQTIYFFNFAKRT